MSQLVCTHCTFQTEIDAVFKEHVSSDQHIDKLCALPKDSTLSCLLCNAYNTTFKNNFRRHVTTCKGKCVKSDVMIACKQCNKQFQTRSGLHKHKLKCEVVQSDTETSHIRTTEVDLERRLKMIENAQVQLLLGYRQLYTRVLNMKDELERYENERLDIGEQIRCLLQSVL
jgi:hypothetical protein